MAWYEISLDHLMNNQLEHEATVVEPRKQAVALIALTIEKIISQLGVDVSAETPIRLLQQDELGIEIKEMDEAQARFLALKLQKEFSWKTLGHYVYQRGEPIAFVSDPYLKNGKVTIGTEIYDTRVKYFEPGELIIPLRGI